MRRLYLQIYAAFLAILVLFAVIASLVWWLAHPDAEERRFLDGVAGVFAELLPGPGAPRAELEQALQKLASDFSADVELRGPGGERLASVGEALPALPEGQRASGLLHSRGGPPAVALRLPDGRWLLARRPHGQHGLGWLLVIAALAAAIGVGAYPVARRITRRLEKLRAEVEELGAGDLRARASVEGSDEVAALARSFNRAAARIEGLVNAQRGLLASASHELRSPLARIRMAVELLAGDARPELRERVEKDIAELDELIGEILLASRLEAQVQVDRPEQIDLLALVAEEAARTDATVGGEPVRVRGDARMLRRLVRNLLENARRHAAGSAVEASVRASPGGRLRLRVEDRGPGVPAAERERIFEPWYRPAGLSESGAGLGLALVRQIARHHGGDARYLPREGGGSCFEVELAAAEVESSSLASASGFSPRR
jgi:signal transduction histidine kinase